MVLDDFLPNCFHNGAAGRIRKKKKKKMRVCSYQPVSCQEIGTIRILSNVEVDYTSNSLHDICPLKKLTAGNMDIVICWPHST